MGRLWDQAVMDSSEVACTRYECPAFGRADCGLVSLEAQLIDMHSVRVPFIARRTGRDGQSYMYNMHTYA